MYFHWDLFLLFIKNLKMGAFFNRFLGIFSSKKKYNLNGLNNNFN